MEQLIKLNVNCLFDYTIKREIDFTHEFKSERWMRAEYVDRIEEDHKLQNGGYKAKTENEE